MHLDLDFLVVELAGAQLLAERVLGGGAGAGADQRVDHARLGGKLGARLDVAALAFARHRDADLDQVAHDLLDVAADIADLGELGRLDLEERRAGEPRQPARDLGLADAGRADHQDVLRQHLLAQLVVELEPPPAVAQRDRDGALGVVLADDEAVELGDDFAGGEVGHCLESFCSDFVLHDERIAGPADELRNGAETGLLVGPHGPCVRRIGVDDDGPVPLLNELFRKRAQRPGADPLRELVRVADRQIDADRVGGQLGEPGMVRDPGGVLVVADEPILDVAHRFVIDAEDEGPRRIAAIDHVADIAEFSSGSPHHSAHMRHRKPAPHQRQVAGRHRMELVVCDATVRRPSASRW